MSDRDLQHLRRAFLIARQARDSGHRPFGAVVADFTTVIVEVGSMQTPQGDPTAHAEMNAVRRAQQLVTRDDLGQATLYASSEPCAMCSAAIFYSGIGRIVFGLAEAELRTMRNMTPHGAGIAMSCREVVARAPRAIDIVGPCLGEEAREPHHDYWSSPA